jgi:hypothetical protein
MHRNHHSSRGRNQNSQVQHIHPSQPQDQAAPANYSARIVLKRHGGAVASVSIRIDTASFCDLRAILDTVTHANLLNEAPVYRCGLWGQPLPEPEV